MLQELQSLSPENKKRVLIVSTIIIMVIVIGVWMSYFNSIVIGMAQQAPDDATTTAAAAPAPTQGMASAQASGPGLWQNIENGFGSIVNIFLGSPMLYWLTTFMGVIVFTGLTAYDTGKLKQLGAYAGAGEARTKLALQGALILYLDFINLFLMLLRIFGGRRRD